MAAQIQHTFLSMAYLFNLSSMKAISFVLPSVYLQIEFSKYATPCRTVSVVSRMPISSFHNTYHSDVLQVRRPEIVFYFWKN